MKLFTACALLTLTGCATHPAAPRELRFSIAGDPATLDPLQVAENNGETIRYMTGGVLLRINRVTDSLEPELAESWKLSDDGAAISFHLREGLRFSDDTPLTAEDVARTLRRALDPKEASPIGDPFHSDSGDPEITTASPLDISIRYKKPKPALDRLFDSLAIIPRTNSKLPASAGPFFVSEYKPGEYVRLARNPHYWKHDSAGKQLPYLDSIRLDIQANHDLELARFLRGDTQLIEKLEPENFDRLAKEQPAAARSLGASLDPEFLWFNEAPSKTVPAWKRKWFTSKAFRKAISGAINRDDIVRIVFHGHAHPAAGLISPANRFWFNTELKPRAFDPQGSLDTLAAAGFTFRDGVLKDHEGHAVEFSLITNSGNLPRERMAPLIQADLKKIGIQVNIVALDFKSLLGRIARTMDYEAALLGFSNVVVDPLNDINVWQSSGAQHAWWPQEKQPATAWEARIDELERDQASAGSRDARKKDVDEVQRIAADEEPIIYLVNPDYLAALSPAVKGAQPTVLPPRLLWNVEWLRIE